LKAALKLTTSQPPQSGKLVASWLKDAETLSMVTSSQAQLFSVQKVLDRIGPKLRLDAPLLAMRIESEHLTLAVPSAAYAAKLKQLAPSIGRALDEAIAQTGTKISRISFRPQPALLPRVKPPRKIEPIQGANLTALRALSQQVEHPILKAALERMVNRHARNKP
jgi:hypothetical protein